MPQAVAEDGQLGAAWPIFLVQKRSADSERHAKYSKITRRNVDSLELLRKSVSGEIHPRSADVISGNIRENLRLCLPYDVLGNRSDVGVSLRRTHLKLHQAIRLWIGQWLKQHGI